MSVKQCSRANCENIMCDRYSSNYGYICNECFDELKGYTSADIQGFMATPPNRLNVLYPFWVEAIADEFREDS